MQKKLIALALAGLVTAPVFAQSNVTIYGRADYGFMSRNGDNGAVGVNPTTGAFTPVDRKNEMASGLQAGSRIGFRGTEDLGNGLKAIFQLEYGITNDVGGASSNSGLVNARNSYVGLTGAFGTLIGGHLDGVRYNIFGKYDAFANGNVANFTQMTAQVDRASNAIAYITPNFSGLTGTLAYSTHIGNANTMGLTTGATAAAHVQEAAGNDGDGILTTAMLAYDNGPISANIDAERIRFNSNGIGVAASVESVKVYTIAGSYDFGVVKVAGLYDILKQEGRNNNAAFDADVRSWFVSAKAPVGSAVVLKATYGRTKNKDLSQSNATKWGIGGDYNLSKRTNLYATYGSIRNNDASRIQLSQSGNGYASGYGVRGFDLGIAHKF